MTRDEIIKLTQEAGLTKVIDCCGVPNKFCGQDQWKGDINAFAALVAAAEREKVARWMMERGYATGHGDTTENLLQELDWQIAENWNRALINGITTERERLAAKFMEMHNSQQHRNNYFAFAARVIREEA